MERGLLAALSLFTFGVLSARLGAPRYIEGVGSLAILIFGGFYLWKQWTRPANEGSVREAYSHRQKRVAVALCTLAALLGGVNLAFAFH